MAITPSEGPQRLLLRLVANFITTRPPPRHITTTIRTIIITANHRRTDSLSI